MIKTLRALRDFLTGPTVVQRWILRSRLPLKVKRYVPPIGPFTLQAPSGEEFVYMAHRDDVMARGLVWDNWQTWERSTAEYLCERFKSASMFWDIGAYAGIYSLLACAVNPDIEVVAVEPLPQHAEWLRANLEANGWTSRVRIVQAAISDEIGEVEIVLVKDDRTASGIGVDREGVPIRVPSVRLIDLGAHADVIKIDIEGGELVALTSIAGFLSKGGTTVVTECLNKDSLNSMNVFAQSLGLSLSHLAVSGLEPITSDFVIPDRHANFVVYRDRLA